MGGGKAGPTIVIQVEGMGEPTRLAHVVEQWHGIEWLAFQQVPVTLEDMAAYLSQEEWECLDPAQRDCSWDVLPENRGNLLISGVSDVGRSRRVPPSLRLAVAGLAFPSSCVWASGTQGPASPCPVSSMSPHILQKPVQQFSGCSGLRDHWRAC